MAADAFRNSKTTGGDMKQIVIYMVLASAIVFAQVARPEGFVEPVNCKMSGEATLISQEFEAGPYVIGDISGTASNAYGSWFHGFGTPETYFLLSPENVTCRINGVQIGNSSGRVSDSSGDLGHVSRYVLEIEDQPTQLHWFTTWIEASRDASQNAVEWRDGSLERPVVLMVPDELPVNEGSAGNQWAILSFVPSDTGAEVTCRYRGTGATALEASDRYLLDACVGAGHTLVGGEEIAVDRIDLHLTGSSPNMRTSVSLPAKVGKTVSDFYVLVLENDAEEVLYSFYGWVDPEAGDFVVESLD